jgi:hypothetical protein
MGMFSIYRHIIINIGNFKLLFINYYINLSRAINAKYKIDKNS